MNATVCDWWYNVDCSSSPSLYPLNEIFKQNTLSRNQASLKSAKLISPAASIKSVTSSGILPSQPETVTSTIPKQQTVTAAAAREPSLHNSAKTYPTVNNTKPSSSYPLPAANTREAFGMKIPSVNRMGGHDMPLIENLVENRPTTDSVDTSSDPEVQFESTEVPPTTIQPLEEDEIRTELSVGEQLASIPNLRKSEAPEILIEKDTIDTKTKTLINDDLYFARKKTFFPTNTYTDKPSTFELNVVKVDEAQASAAITTINAASEKDFDDYATTISSPTINQATNSLELLAITPEESTEYISVTDRTSPEIEIGDSVLANLVTSEATSTEIAQNLKPTLAPSLRDPPAIVGLYFKVLTDSSLGAGIHLNHHSNTTLLPINTEVGTPFSSTKTPAYGININFSSSTLIPAATTTPTSNIIINSTTERTLMTTTTRNSAKSDDSIATIPDKAEEKRTLYGKNSYFNRLYNSTETYT